MRMGDVVDAVHDSGFKVLAVGPEGIELQGGWHLRSGGGAADPNRWFGWHKDGRTTSGHASHPRRIPSLLREMFPLEGEV